MRIDRLGLLAVRSALPIRAFLALIFALALIGKATSMEEFTATLQRSGLIPPTWEEASAVAILVLECLLVVASLVRSLAFWPLFSSATRLGACIRISRLRATALDCFSSFNLISRSF